MLYELMMMAAISLVRDIDSGFHGYPARTEAKWAGVQLFVCDLTDEEKLAYSTLTSGGGHVPTVVYAVPMAGNPLHGLHRI